MKPEVIKAIIRHALGFAGGYFAAKGIELDGAQLEAISGGLAAIVAIVWSLVAKANAKPE